MPSVGAESRTVVTVPGADPPENPRASGHLAMIPDGHRRWAAARGMSPGRGPQGRGPASFRRRALGGECQDRGPPPVGGLGGQPVSAN